MAAMREHYTDRAPAAGGLFGMFSEGFDRLWTPYILQFTFPSIGNLPIITWFGVISIVAMLLTTLVVEFTNRKVDTSKQHSVVRGYMTLIALLIVVVMGFSLASGFIMAISFYWIASALRESIGPLYTTSINQNSKPEVRATVFSIASQANSVGQIFGGPILGFIATIISIRYGLFFGAISLIIILILLLKSQLQLRGQSQALQ